MRNRVTDMLGIDFPLFAFSHCRDVVAAVTNAGGVGVFGAARFSPEQLEVELKWIDEHVGGKPYGIDIVMPAVQAGRGEVDADNFRDDFLAMIPPQHLEFAEALVREHELPEADESTEVIDAASGLSNEGAAHLLDVAVQHPVALLANALGPMPLRVVERAHELGIRTAALVGSAHHAVQQVEQGVDLIVAQGTEAGGHCGEISTMVLVPEVVDAVGETPVLAAGGIGTGRQMAAALALGAQGAWTGSIWLTTSEAEVAPAVMENLLAATATDTVRSRAMTGKPCRQLRTAWTTAWDGDTSPGPLPMPLQTILYAPIWKRAERWGVNPLAGYPVGQIVGRMNSVRSTRELFLDVMTETAHAAEQLDAQLRSSHEPVG